MFISKWQFEKDTDGLFYSISLHSSFPPHEFVELYLLLIRQRDIPSKSTVVESIEDISSNGKTKSYQMFSNANNSWENNLPGIDDLMDITNKLSQMFKAEYSSMSVSDMGVLTTDIHKAIAVMHIKVFRSK